MAGELVSLENAEKAVTDLVQKIREQTAAHIQKMEEKHAAALQAVAKGTIRKLEDEYKDSIAKLARQRDDDKNLTNKHLKETKTRLEEGTGCRRRACVSLMKVAAPLQVWLRLVIPESLGASERDKSVSTRPSNWKCTTTAVSIQGTTFKFDRVFNISAATGDIFTEWRPYISAAVMESRHLLLFAYGRSQTGKSTTLIKGLGPQGPLRDESIVKRSVSFAFTEISEQEEVTPPGNKRYYARVTAIEFLSEKLYDLTTKPKKILFHKPTSDTNLGYMRHKSKDSNRSRLHSRRLFHVKDVVSEIREADRRRGKGKHGNAISSRGHAWYEIRFFCGRVDDAGEVAEAEGCEGGQGYEDNTASEYSEETFVEGSTEGEEGVGIGESQEEEDDTKEEQGEEKGAITFFDLAGMEDIPINDSKAGLESKSLNSALSGLRLAFAGLVGAKEWTPSTKDSKFIRAITDQLLGQGRYQQFGKPLAFVLGHADATKSQEVLSQKVCSTLQSWESLGDPDKVSKDRRLGKGKK